MVMNTILFPQHAEFEEELSLDQGRYEIAVAARNLLGGETRCRIILHVDRSGPLIITERFLADRRIQGYVSDASGVRSFIADLDGKRENISMGQNGSFAISLKSDIKEIVLLVADKLGNETKAMLKEDMTKEVRSSFLISQNAIMGSDRPAFPSPEKGPEIILSRWSDQETVFSKNAGIEGQVRGISAIEELTLNGRSLIEKPGRIISFRQSVRLNPGKNTVNIRARDTSGQTGLRTIVVIRKIPKVFRPEYRYALKICAFDNIGESRNSGVFRDIFPNFQAVGSDISSWGGKSGHCSSMFWRNALKIGIVFRSQRMNNWKPSSGNTDSA